MAQVTWRAPDALVARVREVAAREGRSMNDFLSRVLEAVTDPGLAGSEAERIRERLARAGLLADRGEARPTRPHPEALARARARAGRGTELAELVTQGRE